MAFLDEIADRLVAQGVGTLGTNIFGTGKAVIPAGDGPFLSLTETGGTGSAKTQNNTATERPSAQLLARAKTAMAARRMLVSAYVALGGENGLYNLTLSGRAYISIVSRQGPTEVGLDGSGRMMYSFNIDAERQGGGEWEDITSPIGWNWGLPFIVQQRGRVFRADPSFNIQTHAAIAVAKTYYVDKATGNNGNAGTSWVTALADVKTAYAKADVDRIYVKAGYYFLNECNAAPTRSLEIIADGAVTISGDVRNEIGAWTAVGNHYEATVSGGRTVARVMDAAVLNALGNDSTLTSRASVALVDANPGSWNQTGMTIAVRTADGRAPDSNVRYFTTTASLTYTQNRTMYCEGITFLRSVVFNNASSAGGLKVYFKNCTIGGAATFNGAEEVIAQNCTVKQGSSDGFNYNILNTIVPKVIEINCESFDSGATSTDQASTTHNGTTCVRIMGKYHHVAGQCIADVDTAKTWMLGTEFYNSTSGIGFYTDGTVWLDSCYSYNNGVYDLQGSVSSIIYTRNFIGERGVNDILGVLTTY